MAVRLAMLEEDEQVLGLPSRFYSTLAVKGPQPLMFGSSSGDEGAMGPSAWWRTEHPFGFAQGRFFDSFALRWQIVGVGWRRTDNGKNNSNGNSKSEMRGSLHYGGKVRRLRSR